MKNEDYVDFLNWCIKIGIAVEGLNSKEIVKVYTGEYDDNNN